MIVQARVTDPARFAAYTKVVPALVAQFGGRYRVLGGTTDVLEGDWHRGLPLLKTVVSEWPDRAAAMAFWTSPEYREAAQLREGTGEFTIVVIDGL